MKVLFLVQLTKKLVFICSQPKVELSLSLSTFFLLYNIFSDVDSVQSVCESRACEGQFWKVKTVKETRRVKVRGFSATTTREDLRRYFVQFTSSAVGEVDMLDDGKTCILHLIAQGGL